MLLLPYRTENAPRRLPLITWLLTGSTELTVTVGIMAVIVIVRHRTNIQRLLSGEEGSIKTADKPDGDDGNA